MEKVGVLVITVWMEYPQPSGLRVRLTHLLDVSGTETAISAAASIDDTTTFVRGWLEAFVAAATDAAKPGRT